MKQIYNLVLGLLMTHGKTQSKEQKNEAEEGISELKYKVVEITAMEQNKEERMKKK